VLQHSCHACSGFRRYGIRCILDSSSGLTSQRLPYENHLYIVNRMMLKRFAMRRLMPRDVEHVHSVCQRRKLTLAYSYSITDAPEKIEKRRSRRHKRRPKDRRLMAHSGQRWCSPWLVMVRLATDDGPGTVELLQQHETRYLVVQHARGQAGGGICTLPHFVRMPIRAPNAEHQALGTPVTCTCIADGIRNGCAWSTRVVAHFVAGPLLSDGRYGHGWR
jgi:hypothetical protein